MPKPKATGGSTPKATNKPSSSKTFYLLKAEPETRIEKGKDVKFSVDDFEQVGTSPWEGVRNYEARNIMKEMKVGDQALFYHSNCKNPGIAAFAEVSKLAYPDYTAWDTTHPYYDPKSDSENPKWYMVDLTFRCRAKHFVPLALLKYIASVSLPASSADDGGEVPGLIDELAYLGRPGVAAIKGMDLVTRGRLSVQRVSQAEWDTINLLAETGGWEDLDMKKLGSTSSSSKATSASKAKSAPPKKGTGAAPKRAGKGKKRQLDEDVEEESGEGSSAAGAVELESLAKAPPPKKSRKAKQPGDEADVGGQSSAPLRRSSRRASSKVNTG